MYKLILAALIFTCTVAGAESPTIRVFRAAEIPTRPLPSSPGWTPPPLPESVAFSVGAPEVIDRHTLRLRGVLTNPLGRELFLVTFGGNEINPFSLQPIDEGKFRWSPEFPLFPPAPAIPVIRTIPPHSRVEYEARYDLGRLQYQGTPSVRFAWRFGFYLQREAESGTIQVVLP